MIDGMLINTKVDLAKELNEQLSNDTVIPFTVNGIDLGFDEATVVSWIIMAVLVLISFLLTRNLKVTGDITKRQMILELCYEKLEGFFKGILGREGERYIPWLMSLAIFIGTSNIIGLFGLKPPTKSMQVTAVMALTSIVLVESAGIRVRGLKGHLKSFSEPVAIVTPINILEVAIKPLSLCMRLFGNVLGAFIIMELIKAVVPIVIPTILSLYFDIFDGILQAYIFVFLTSLYIKESMEIPEPKEKKVKKSKKKKALATK